MHHHRGAEKGIDMSKTIQDFKHQIQAIRSRIVVESNKRPHWPKRMEARRVCLEALQGNLLDAETDLAKLEG